MKQKTFFHAVRTTAVMMTLAALAGLTSCKTHSILEDRSATSLQNHTPVKMILDADFGSSTDDLFALMMLNNYIDSGLVDLKGIIVDREGEKNAGVVDIFNTYYGHPDIPVGLERNGVKNPRCFIPYNGICDLKNAQGQPLFKRSLNPSECMDGYKLYRKLLSQAEDKSIVVVAIGFATTLSQLMESGADEYSSLSGLDLFGKKVKAVYIQSGRFEANDSLCGYNMRAASKQSAVFYDKFPKDVELIMSPSNIGDQMDYQPGDVLADLSDTEYNPIKAVYTHYTCDTGQRMWDTNCLVNAVLGDSQYHLSPRGWVKFIDRGEESLMLFKADPQGNARYQVPGDSYFNMEKLMDIRRHNRINRYPARYTIEAPQPFLLGDDAVGWAKPRVTQLMDKYLGTAGNKLDPDEFREVFRPIGYFGTNVLDYRKAEKMIVDTLYTVMLQKALNLGKKSFIVITGAPASGKSTAARQLDLAGAGLIYDAALSGQNHLESVIERAEQAGMEKVTVMMVYNDIMTCYKNSINRGKTSHRFIGLDYMVSSFRNNIGRLKQLAASHPEIEIVPIDRTGNQPFRQVSLEEAINWKYDVTEQDIHDLLTYLSEQIDEGELQPNEVSAAAGDLLSIQDIGASNVALAKEIDQKIRDIVKASKVR